ncbi:ABC transporter substrate-binding protein [Nonomuraea sp. B5E05]|uniref:ABC transporter substrate-binding protein n=1 Tax=Nonomuraea sp. B5E05 TaxID=3153569 RepID=UPI00326102A0
MGVVRPLRPSDPPSVGSYKITGFLGEGGQGSVYLGASPSGEQVAIKLLHARFTDDEQAVRRFRREAEAARRVAAFCTARVLDVGTMNDQPYIVGEYVEGPSLQHQVTRQGPIQGPALTRMAITTATALAAIHEAGVVHRDFKPSNVLLGPDGPRVIDFGIARALDISQSMTSGIVGTPAFMAPEQFLGDASPASDVFAWAGTMVFAATGRVTFGSGPMPVVMHRILNVDPDLSGVPDELVPLLRAALAKDHRQRPDARQLIQDLIRAGTAPPAAAGPAPMRSQPQAGDETRPYDARYPRSGPMTPPAPVAAADPLRRRKVLIPAGAVATALVVGLAGWLVWQATPPANNTAAGSTPAPSTVKGFGAAVASVANPSAKKGGTLNVAFASSLDSTDPGNMYLPDSLNLVRLYGRSLTMFKPAPGGGGAQIVPDLAESLGVPSDGGRTWTYTLRQGVKYQDGTPITAQDVKYAVLRSMDPGFASGSSLFDLTLDLPAGYQGPYRSPGANTDSAIETPDDRTIVFHLKRPAATFDHTAQLPETIPVPEAEDTKARYAAHVVSSGPYRLRSVGDRRVVLARNEHWGADPHRTALPDGYVIEFEVGADDATQRLRAGTLDYGPEVARQAVGAVLGDPALKARADTPVTASVQLLAINPQVPPFDDVECRRAVVRALDLSALARVYGATRTPTSLLPPTIAGRRHADPNLTPAGDPEAARESLRACGSPSGFTATYLYRDLSPIETSAAEAVQAALAKVGIDLTLERKPLTDFYQKYGGSPAYLKKEKVGLIAKTWSPDWPDPGAFLPLIADSREINEEDNSINVSVRVKEIDTLIDQAGTELDPARRAGLWTQVERRLTEEAVLVPLAWRTPLLLRGARAANVHVSPVFGNYELVTMGLT